MTLPSPSKEEDAIIKVLRKRWSHVSAERVLSGAGLVNFYEALCTMRAFSHFCAFLGSAAGDLALTFGATGAYTSPAGYWCEAIEQSSDALPGCFDSWLGGVSEQRFQLCEHLLDRIEVRNCSAAGTEASRRRMARRTA